MTYSESSASADADPCRGTAYGAAPAAAPKPERASRGQADWTELGDVMVMQIASEGQARQARFAGTRVHPPRCFVHLMLEGEGNARQDGREVLLRSGDFTLCDGTRHFEISCPTGSLMLVLGIPTAKLRRHVACPESLAAVAMRAGSGVNGLLSGFLRTYWRECRHSLDADSAERIAVAVLDLLGAAYAQVPRTHAERSSRGTAHRIRILNYIHAHLYESELTPAQIAQACRITTRYLHYLFSDGEETVTRYILKRRLEACSQALLAEGQRGRTVTAIAFDHGFNSATHFGRVFRSQFGMTPREYRARAPTVVRPARRDAVAPAAAGC